jgi:hypothetical protein
MSDGEHLLEEIARDEDLSVTTLAPSDDSVSAVISEYPQRFVRHYSPPEALRRKALSITCEVIAAMLRLARVRLFDTSSHRLLVDGQTSNLEIC